MFTLLAKMAQIRLVAFQSLPHQDGAPFFFFFFLLLAPLGTCFHVFQLPLSKSLGKKSENSLALRVYSGSGAIVLLLRMWVDSEQQSIQNWIHKQATF